MEQMLLPILMFAALGAMMYFGMRKQKRQVAETQKMQERLVPGTRVMTTSGLHGEVTAVADDTIELEIAPGIRTTWVRAAVRDIVVEKPADLDEENYPADDVDDTEYDSAYDADGYQAGNYNTSSYDQSGTGEVSLDKRQTGRSDIG
jgi:preprotein translocase subunit YajC